MTSNIGADIILKAPILDEKIKIEIESLLQKFFKPEFLNRIDSIVFFRKLNEKNVREIAAIMFIQIEKRILEKGFEIKISDSALMQIANLGYEPEFGARPLKRAIQNYLTVPLSRHILEYPEKKQINIDFKNEKFLFI